MGQQRSQRENIAAVFEAWLEPLESVLTDPAVKHAAEPERDDTMKTLQLHNAKIVRVLSFLVADHHHRAFGLFTCVEAATALFTESFEEVDQNGLHSGMDGFAQGPMGRSDDYAHSGNTAITWTIVVM